LSRLADAAPILLLLSALPLGGCPATLPPNLREATVKPSDLPGTAEEVLRYAEDESKKETASAEENVIVAVDHGLGKDGKSYELLWRGARACAWLTEEFTEKNTRASYAQKGVDYARRAIELEPKRVEAHYYLGINLGQSATTKTVGAYSMVPKVVKAAESAMAIDERFDHAGPPRLYGTVFAKAPAWPASIGDLDKGIQFLSRAVQLAPEYPQNHLHYGDALLSDGKLNEAEAEYKKVLEAPANPEWDHRAERWKHDAEVGLKKIAEKRADP
jgi:tetratricopeptide (TPR) repeat protein